MTTEKMFEIAVRSKMRFPFKGQIFVEDLWDLDVNALDSVFKSLNIKVKESIKTTLTYTIEKIINQLYVGSTIERFIDKEKLSKYVYEILEKENLTKGE